MIDVIRNIGGWQAIDPKFDLKKWDFEISLHKLHNDYSFGGLFFWYVAENDKNSSEYIIQVLRLIALCDIGPTRPSI